MIERMIEDNRMITTNYANSPIIWIARGLILVVTLWNIQCALVFIFKPVNFISSFNLSGVVGATVVRSIGLLFLMWNIPYLFALIHPIRWQICLWVAVIQQFLGVAGETWIRSLIPLEPVLRSTIFRFIIFDAAGLFLLMAALVIINIQTRKGKNDVYKHHYDR